MKEESYCLTRTKQRILWLFWSVIAFFISAALGVVCYMGITQDSLYPEYSDNVTIIVSGAAAIGAFLIGIYVGYVAIRDTLFPAKSALAASIRNQLSHSEEFTLVEDLFAMVDSDLREHGKRFEAVFIGEEWVLGELANRIELIRGIFTVDELHHHNTQTGVRSSRKLQLVLIDENWNCNKTGFRNPKELKAAADYLSFLVPEAKRGCNSQYLDFLHMDDVEREAFKIDFHNKQSRRFSEKALKKY